MKTIGSHFTSDLARYIWESKYRYCSKENPVDETIEDSWRRIARSLAQIEPANQDRWEERFYRILEDFRFLPGGRIQAGAGTDHRVTLLNCFVMNNIDDSMDAIFENLKEGALTMQMGGGVGYDFSRLRPHGTRAISSNNIASGPVSFMHIWNQMCETLLSTGTRRGAMMATLRIDHPDIEAFIEAKNQPGTLSNFNLSVQVTDAFMEAVRDGKSWPLVFPAKSIPQTNGGEKTINRIWTGTEQPVPCSISKTVDARSLWLKLTEASYNYGEPGVLFTDHINNTNNLWYNERITATNPCGEVPLPPYGSCDLGSLNLTAFVRDPFTAEAHLDLQTLRKTVPVAVRMLDNVLDLTRYPLAAQQQLARQSRRIGLGITGLADALIMLEIHYGSAEARKLAGRVMKTIAVAAYRASIDLASEKGAFPLFKTENYLKGLFIHSLPDGIQNRIEKEGIRNSHLLSVAPTGSISLLANNISSGIEPVFDFRVVRKIREHSGDIREFEVTDYAYWLWMSLKGSVKDLPDYFTHARELSPHQHLAMQAAIQPYVDQAISKTINIPENYPFDEYRSVFEEAYGMQLKGCTTFRPNPVTGSVLEGADSNGETKTFRCPNDTCTG